MTVDQKFAKAMLEIRDLRPFYSSVYEVIDKIETNEVDTMGVTADKLMYNYEFCDKLEFSEFLFVILHEIGHIALMHVARCKGREASLWNIACDLYVNKVLKSELGTNIKMPSGAVYFDAIDIEKDAAETIYEELYSQAKQNGYFSRPDINQKDSHGNSDGKSQKNSKQYKFTLKRGSKKYDINIGVNYRFDLVYGNKNSAELESDSRRLITDAQIRNQLLGGDSVGNSVGLLERLCSKMLESKIDWRKIIKKHLLEYRQLDTSYAKPDKRMYWQSAIYPGPVPSTPDFVKGVKVCIDTSGSISDDDMSEFLGHIVKLTKQFKVDADLVYWDSKVQSAGKLKSTKDLSRVDILGGGGTNPDCVFESFDKNKEKPILVIMLTDGYFMKDDLDNPTWKKKYKNTVWILCEDGNKDFVPKFGRLANLKDGLNK